MVYIKNGILSTRYLKPYQLELIWVNLMLQRMFIFTFNQTIIARTRNFRIILTL